MNDSCRKSDLVANRIGLLLWGLPIILLVVGAIWAEARVWLWTPALLTAGAACIANAARCRRVHCYLTGPLYLLGGMVTLLRGLDIVPLPWSWIGYGLLGGTFLAYIPEWIRGKYAE